jgi:hypothetical protein
MRKLIAGALLACVFVVLATLNAMADGITFKGPVWITVPAAPFIPGNCGPGCMTVFRGTPSAGSGFITADIPLNTNGLQYGTIGFRCTPPMGQTTCRITLDGTLLYSQPVARGTIRVTGRIFVTDAAGTVINADGMNDPCRASISNPQSGPATTKKCSVNPGQWTLRSELSFTTQNGALLNADWCFIMQQQARVGLTMLPNTETAYAQEASCPGSVGGISLDPSATALPLQSQPSSGSDAWLLAEALAGTAAAAVALGGAAWYARTGGSRSR